MKIQWVNVCLWVLVAMVLVVVLSLGVTLCCFYGNNLTNRIKLTDLLTVLCDRVGVVLLGQLYQIIVSPWIKVSNIVNIVISNSKQR